MRSKQPLRPLMPQGFVVYPLVDGPSAWFYGTHRPGWDPTPRLQWLLDEHARVDPLYRSALKAAQAGDGDLTRAHVHELTQLLEDHLRYEETTLFPAAAGVLDPDGRILRELGYEHQGVRAGLKRYPALLESVLAGTATTREVERMELDLLHMFEHHQEREELALYPWLERTLPQEALVLPPQTGHGGPPVLG